MMTWAYKLMLITGEGRDSQFSRPLRSLEAARLYVLPAGPISATLRDSL